jgi:arylsulfatase A-like enzyme
VLLVVVDTARADHFGPFGGRARTPAFDTLAARGQATRAISTSPWTVPSHASLFSGLLPFDHGVTGAAAITPQRHLASLAPAIEKHRERWLPEVLRTAGYQTLGVSANVWVTPPMGFDLGFDRFVPVGMARVTPRGAKAERGLADLLPDGLRRRLKRTIRYARDAREGRDFGSREILKVLKPFAAGHHDRPFFCFVNVMETHAPYLPPAGFNPLSSADRWKAPHYNHKYLGDEFVAAYNLGEAEAPAEALATLGKLYAAEVSYADAFLGQLLDAFAPSSSSTLVVVTADHGENLGEDHLLGHVLSLDERLISVPLAVAGPGAEAFGLADRPVTSLAWLPGLIARAIGLDRNLYDEPADVAVAQYESGWNHLRKAADVERRYQLTAEQKAAFRATHQAATDGATFVIRTADAERVVGPPDPAERLRAALAPAADASAEAGAYSPEEEAEIEERLSELGYL